MNIGFLKLDKDVGIYKCRDSRDMSWFMTIGNRII